MPLTTSLACGVATLLMATLLDSILTADMEASGVKSYVGYKLLRTSRIAESKTAAALMRSLDVKDGLQFWTFPQATLTTDILASPRLYPHVQRVLEQLGLDYEVLQNDINEWIEEEKTEAAEAKGVGASEGAQSGSLPPRPMDWKSYHRYKDIYAYCEALAASHSASGRGVQVRMYTIGTTTEDRPIVLMRVSNGRGRGKPAVWMDGGMHAREWISPATVTFILDALVNNPSKTQEMLDEFNWYIVPVVNIDGYEYTHTKDRLWRKTRSFIAGSSCRGVDANRNWSYKWGRNGSSDDPCDETYRGPVPFSEPETQAVAQAILARRNKIKLYLSFHSYSQFLLLPWGYGNKKPSDYKNLYTLAQKGTEALEATYGTHYEIGTPPDLLYVAPGGSFDWAKGAAGIKYSYTFELRDTGHYGFTLPKKQIIPTGEETLNAVRALALGLRDRLKSSTPQLLRHPNVPATLSSHIPHTPPSPLIAHTHFQSKVTVSATLTNGNESHRK